MKVRRRGAGRVAGVCRRGLLLLLLLGLCVDGGFAQPSTPAENGGFPVDVPTNMCRKCGVRYPTRQSDADLYGTITIFDHAEICGQEPDPDAPPAVADGDEPPVVCGGVSAASSDLAPPATAKTLTAVQPGPLKTSGSRLGVVLKRRILELRATSRKKLLPFAPWTPPSKDLVLDLPSGTAADFWKKAAE